MPRVIIVGILWFILYPVYAGSFQPSADSVQTVAADTALPAMPDTIPATVPEGHADDPSNFLSRIEVFNTLKHYDNETYVNVTTLRTVIKFSRKFTTRIDVPLVYNSKSLPVEHAHYGLGDISVRLLGYSLYSRPRSALTASVEFAFNTATSPQLGTGKNIILPVLTYSILIKENKGIVSFLFQQANSLWGDTDRQPVNFSKIQALLITQWSKRFRTVLSPELFIDYENKGVSMNLRGRLTYIPVPLVNIWADLGAGLFGDFIDRYQWTMELGFRYHIFRKPLLKK